MFGHYILPESLADKLTIGFDSAECFNNSEIIND